jgi:hypothetical protein
VGATALTCVRGELPYLIKVRADTPLPATVSAKVGSNNSGGVDAPVLVEVILGNLLVVLDRHFVDYAQLASRKMSRAMR